MHMLGLDTAGVGFVSRGLVEGCCCCAVTLRSLLCCSVENGDFTDVVLPLVLYCS